MDAKLLLDLGKLLENTGLGPQAIKWINLAFGLIVIFIIAWTVDIITRKVVLNILKRLAKRTKTLWDDILLEKKVFNRLAHVVPAVIIYSLIGLVLSDFPPMLNFIKVTAMIYIIVMVLLSADSFLNSVHQIYNTLSIAKDRSISGYIQVVKIIVYFVAIILIFSIVTGKTPKYFLTGLGTMAAVLLLVFRDTILGFVASIQLSANDMLRIGDWITMPSHKADGDVLEITLNTVKVQNFDKTVVTIPTYALVSNAFTNWRGMEESEGRRIKRHINIDMRSVKFCSPEMIEKFQKIQYLKSYIEAKESELKEFNQKQGIDNTINVNGRRMTNIGTFRKYLEEYLHNHPKIHQKMTFLVRQLQPSEMGIPIEIYVFSNDQAWANYEAIQADIFDHILAVIPEFELSVFQNPTGEDFTNFNRIEPRK